MPASMAVLGQVEIAPSRPLTYTLALELGSPRGLPNRLSASSVRPDPIRPAKPTISPFLTLKLMSWRMFRPQGRVVRAPVLDLQHHLVGRCALALAGRCSSISRPTMCLISARFGHLALVGVQRDDRLAVAQHRDLVRDRDDFLQLVGDQHAR